MQKNESRLRQLALNLEMSLAKARVDARQVYRIRSNTSLFPQEMAKALETIFEQFDKAVESDAEGFAFSAMEKLLGVLEGLADDYEAEASPSVTDNLVPTFELNASDKERVFELCFQMRKIILASDVFDQAHRRRLLDRIAGIEHQVEQPKGMLDVVRMGVSDVGETLGKFGSDIKPLTDRMKEVSDITRRGSKQYEQIPAPDEVKQLPAPDKDSEE